MLAVQDIRVAPQAEFDAALAEMDEDSAPVAPLRAAPLGVCPGLFSLSREQTIDAVAKELADMISVDVPLPLPEEIQPFAGSVRFDGSVSMVNDLLEKIVHAGVEPKALIAALVLTRRLVALVKERHGADAARIPPTAGKAIILTTAILASKYNFDVGARMKDVKKDCELCAELGGGLVGKFGALEEHLLVLFDWQLRVSVDEYTDTCDKLARIATASTPSPGSAVPARVQSFPGHMSDLQMDGAKASGCGQLRGHSRNSLLKGGSPFSQGFVGPVPLQKWTSADFSVD